MTYVNLTNVCQFFGYQIFGPCLGQNFSNNPTKEPIEKSYPYYFGIKLVVNQIDAKIGQSYQILIWHPWDWNQTTPLLLQNSGEIVIKFRHCNLPHRFY